MTSTEFNVGMSSDRSSSRVLAPPGGGSSILFGGDSEVKVNSPRPKGHQQNSSNLNFCMNTVDPNILVEQVKQTEVKKAEAKAAEPAPANKTNGNSAAEAAAATQSRGGARVPPGGFSSGGFW